MRVGDVAHCSLGEGLKAGHCQVIKACHGVTSDGDQGPTEFAGVFSPSLTFTARGLLPGRHAGNQSMRLERIISTESTRLPSSLI